VGDDATWNKLEAWLRATPLASRRCGVAADAAPDGTRILAVVVVAAFADLAPLPLRVRSGQWLTVDARLRVPARGGRVFVLGPSGSPHAVPTSFDGLRLRAAFAPDSAGEHTIQVVADLASGPRPVVEASVFADVEPPPRAARRPAPGEDVELPAEEDDRLSSMLAVARASSGLPPLLRDPRLDAIARAHAARMARQHDLAHDAGDGRPVERMRDAGLEPRDVGENVAHAETLALAHHAQWWSPSHRANMLRTAPDRVGVGVARDEHGDAWVVELFAALP
jgi:uncharacterized protein YkwD